MSTAPPTAVPAAEPRSPRFQQFSVEFAPARRPSTTEVMLDRTSMRFDGRRREASLSLLKDVIWYHGSRNSVVALRIDGQEEATLLGPDFFEADNLTAQLHFRVFHGELYVEIRLLSDSIDREGYIDLQLYRVGPTGAPVKVLEESLEVWRGHCGLVDRVELMPVRGRPGELRLVVRRERGRAHSPQSGESDCAESRPGVRSQSYVLREDCFYPGIRPLYFAPALERIGGVGSSCDANLCTPELPRSALAAELVRRARGAVLEFSVPEWWVAVNPPHDPGAGAVSWRAFELGPDCRVVFSGHRKGTPSRYVHSHNPDDVDDLTRLWISDHCRPESYSCISPCGPGQQLTPPVCEHLDDRRTLDWVACGDMSRARARDATRVLDAIALRVPQDDGSSAAVLATLACDRELYDDAVVLFEAALARIAFVAPSEG